MTIQPLKIEAFQQGYRGADLVAIADCPLRQHHPDLGSESRQQLHGILTALPATVGLFSRPTPADPAQVAKTATIGSRPFPRPRNVKLTKDPTQCGRTWPRKVCAAQTGQDIPAVIAPTG